MVLDLYFTPTRQGFRNDNEVQQFSSRLTRVRRMREKLYLARHARGEDASCEFPCQCEGAQCSHSLDTFTENHLK